MAVQDYKINYKSDFVLNINGDAGWTTQFCIKFWTGMPSQAYFVGFDGVKYVNCRVGDTPTQLLVMFDDHHLPIGKLKMQIAYHTTIEEFPGSVFDEVTNARDVIVTIDGTDYQVLLDFTGEDAPELEFDLPAYANEAERIQNELQRQQNEADRIAAELQREQATAAAVEGAENVNAQLNGTTLTVTNRQGVSTSVNTKGEQGEQGPVGPEGPQGQKGVSVTGLVKTGETDTDTLYNVTFSDGTTQAVAIPKGAKGDTGATGPTGPQGPQGQTGVSITGLVKTGETDTDTLYNITFSDGTTQQVAIPKGEQGVQGEQGPAGPTGPQGPMGDVAVITPEQQAAFTMYSTTGQNTDGPMTQKAVTDALGNIAASSVSYNNSQSGLAATNVQGALDEVGENLLTVVGGEVTYTKADCTLYGTINGNGHITEETTSNWLLSPWIELPDKATTIVYSGSVNLTTAKGMALYASNDESTFIRVFTGSGTINLENYPTAQYMRIMSHTSRTDANINVRISYNGKLSDIDTLNQDMDVLKGQFHSFFPSEDTLVGEQGYYWNVTTIGLRKAANNNNWYWYDYIDVRKLVGTSIKLSLTDLSYTWIVFEDDTYVKASTLSPTISGNYKVFTIPQNAAKLCVSWAYNWTTSGDRTKVFFAHEGLGNYDELVEQVEELVGMSDSVSDKVSVNNSDCLLLMGSSLTAAITMPAGYNWADKLNDLLDIPVVNGGHGGNNMLGNIAEVANAGTLYVDSGLKFNEFNKTYILWGNSANGTVDGINGYKALDMAELITKRYGAEIIIGSEEPFGGNAGRYAESQWANAHNVPYMIAQKILEKTLMHNGSGYYGGWIWQGHRGWRGMGAYVNAYMDLMRELPIINSVKMYKVRDKFLSYMSSVDDLVYDNNTERLYKFHAADAGSIVNSAFTTSSTFNGADNLDNASYNITGSSISSVSSSLTGRMLAGKVVTFTNYALIEMVLNVHSLNKFSFSCGCSATPSNVYLIKCPTSNFPTSLSTYNSKIESVVFTYEGNEVKFELSEFNGVLLYDKVRILVKCSGDFTLSNPQATYAGQRKKVGKYVNYQQRKIGTELRTNTGMVASDWTLSGASIISFPSGVKCYTRYNDIEAVLKLVSNSDTAVTTVTHQQGKRVAIRIVAQNFFKWMTTRYSGSEYSDYVASTPQLGAYEYDYGKLYLTVNDKYGQELLVPSGWAELYTEVDCEEYGNLTIKLQRANESGIYSSAGTPIYIHDLSVQEI